MKIPSIGKTETLILTALSSGDRYGLEIIDKAHEISERKIKLSLGGLYTTLHRMEEKGLIASRWGESTEVEVRQGARRKYYKVTGLGIKALNEATKLFKSVIDYRSNPASVGAL
jgi:DNA-binding PadR family transcriptional regulator